MRSLLAFSVGLIFAFTLGSIAQQKTPPPKVVFESKMGNVTFDHAKHVEREKNDCTVCHDKLFPQSKAPINFKLGMHKPAEAKKTSCAACHVAGGRAYQASLPANCKKCHVKG